MFASRIALALLACGVWSAVPSSRALDPALAEWPDVSARPTDVLVYGATPAGVSVAVAAAREGARVTLIEPTRWIGGVLTCGGLNTLDMSRDGRTGELLTRGFFETFHAALGRPSSLTVTDTAATLLRFASRAGVRVVTGVRATTAVVRGGRVTEVRLRSDRGAAGVVRAAQVVDATDDAELAALAGARFTLGREDTGLDRRMMAATLVFRVGGVSWTNVRFGVWRHQLEHSSERMGADTTSAYGFSTVTRRYRPSDPARFALRGLNMGRQKDGSVLVNALQVYGVDGTNLADVARARRDGEREARRVVAFLRDSLPSLFARATFEGAAPCLYVRESRHLLGLTRLSALDVVYGRTFADTVALGSYPLDGQRYRPEERPLMMGHPLAYGVPLSTTIPKDLTNVWVASRSASFDAAAAFSARTVPVQMALGEAVGVASTWAWRANVTNRAVVRDETRLAALLARLREVGAKLESPSLDSPSPDARDARFEAAARLYRRALFGVPPSVRGGLGLREPLLARSLAGSLLAFDGYLARRRGRAPRTDVIDALLERSPSQRFLTRRDLHRWLATYARAADLPFDDRVPPQGRRVVSRGEAAEVLAAAFERFEAFGAREQASRPTGGSAR